MLKLKFSEEIMREITHKNIQEPDPGPCSNPQNGSLIKIQTKYMNSGGLVQVSVWECTKQGHVGRIAAKICKSRTRAGLQEYIQEAQILQQLSGKMENFLLFYESYLTEEIVFNEKFFIFTIEIEYIERNLKEDKERRDNTNSPYSAEEFLQIYVQLVSAFCFLKTLNIMHRDIKPSNILITNDGKIKVIDFNVANNYSEVTINAKAVGSKDFMAPEVRTALDQGADLAKYKSDKTDVFSLGMTLLSLITNESLVDLNLLKNRDRLYQIAANIKFD